MTQAGRHRAKPARSSTRTPRRLARRAAELRDHLTFLLEASNPAFVYFLETRNRGVFLRAAPIDVSHIINEMLFNRMRATIMTSATLTVAGSFDYVKGRLGVPMPTACACSRSSISPSRRSSTCRSRCRRRNRRNTATRWRAKCASCCSAPRAARSCCSRATRCCGRCAIWSSRELPYPDHRARHGAAQRAARRSSARRPTRCCSRPRRSGRASTWSASS